MANRPIRRAQLIAPFGVGAMIVGPDGIGLIAAGLDHWYKDPEEREIDHAEFQFGEWRLEQRLGVDHFRLPPDFRKPQQEVKIPNVGLKVPFLRFPQWHYCPSCKRMKEVPLTARGRQKCLECEKKGNKRYLVQVTFVAICEHGHLQDFPWREWVHRSIKPDCQKSLRLVSTGGASLAAQKVKCDCGAERSLSSITIARPDGTTILSSTLEEGENEYLCQGGRPWLGTEEGEPCDSSLRGSLRNASNVYFANVYSAIYLPRSQDETLQQLITLMEEKPLSDLIELLQQLSVEAITPQNLRKQHSQLLRPYKDPQIEKAIQAVLDPTSEEESTELMEDEDQETAFRRVEFETLRMPREAEQLFIRPAPLKEYKSPIRENFSKVMLVYKLRETRALAGFSRIFPENIQSLEQQKALLWKNPPTEADEWLPAYKVFGEGIFLELNEKKLQQWEQRADVIERVQPLIKRYEQVQQRRQLESRPIGPRFILLHTLSHLLMNRLTFECGYSSAALRERLYISSNPRAPMAGILIYTAAGDSEGTLGGLVRMGKSGFLEPTLQRALEEARWCSADPVCMELGSRGGQGPNSCNLAACHNCALVPETACEEFNQFLDRAVVVGVPDNRKMGFFHK